MPGSDKENNFPVTAVIIIAVLVLFWMLKPSGNKKTEKYNAGNNIDFNKTKTDRNLPTSVMPKTDVHNIGSPFVIIDNP